MIEPPRPLAHFSPSLISQLQTTALTVSSQYTSAVDQKNISLLFQNCLNPDVELRVGASGNFYTLRKAQTVFQRILNGLMKVWYERWKLFESHESRLSSAKRACTVKQNLKALFREAVSQHVGRIIEFCNTTSNERFIQNIHLPWVSFLEFLYGLEGEGLLQWNSQEPEAPLFLFEENLDLSARTTKCRSLIQRFIFNHDGSFRLYWFTN